MEVNRQGREQRRRRISAGVEARDEEPVSDATIPTMFASAVRPDLTDALGRHRGLPNLRDRVIVRWRVRGGTHGGCRPIDARGVDSNRMVSSVPSASPWAGGARDLHGDQDGHAATSPASQCSDQQSPRLGVAKKGLCPHRVVLRDGDGGGRRRPRPSPAGSLSGVCTEVGTKPRSHRDTEALVRRVAAYALHGVGTAGLFVLGDRLVGCRAVDGSSAGYHRWLRAEMPRHRWLRANTGRLRAWIQVSGHDSST